MIPGGTHLYAGPDTSQPSVGTVPANYAILAAEPVVWHDQKRGHLARLLRLLRREEPVLGEPQPDEPPEPAGRRAASPRCITKTSLEPITVSDQNFAWKSSTLTFIIGRGELFGPIA